jgi:hypothetical protein
MRLAHHPGRRHAAHALDAILHERLEDEPFVLARNDYCAICYTFK